MVFGAVKEIGKVDNRALPKSFGCDSQISIEINFTSTSCPAYLDLRESFHRNDNFPLRLPRSQFPRLALNSPAELNPSRDFVSQTTQFQPQNVNSKSPNLNLPYPPPPATRKSHRADPSPPHANSKPPQRLVHENLMRAPPPLRNLPSAPCGPGPAGRCHWPGRLYPDSCVGVSCLDERTEGRG
jgi:hypothetical protein